MKLLVNVIVEILSTMALTSSGKRLIDGYVELSRADVAPAIREA